MKQPYYKGNITDHYNGTIFSNLRKTSKPFSLTVIGGIKCYLHSLGKKWTGISPNVVQAHPAGQVEGLTITMIGHASILVQIEGYNILVDPVWSTKIGPIFFTKKRANPPGVPFFHLPHIDAVIITHNHYDHMDIKTLRRIYKRHKPIFFTPLGNDTILKKQISSKIVIHAMDWFEEQEMHDSIKITTWPAQHWSARGLFDRNKALWGGFVLSSSKYTVYITGDTGYGDGTIFKQIKEKFPSLDVAVINIGAYAPRSLLEEYHNDPAEALQIFLACGAKQAVGIHWGTFQLSSEEVYEPVHTLYGALRNHLLPIDSFIPLRPGQVWSQKEITASEGSKGLPSLDELQGE